MAGQRRLMETHRYIVSHSAYCSRPLKLTASRPLVEQGLGSAALLAKNELPYQILLPE